MKIVCASARCGSRYRAKAWSIHRIDRDAAGRGWFVDATPDDHTEFDAIDGNNQSEGAVDLLTVLTHELGHLVGLDEIFGDTNDIMGIGVSIGTRRLPDAVSSPLYAPRFSAHASGDRGWTPAVDEVFGASTADVIPSLNQPDQRSSFLPERGTPSMSLQELSRSSKHLLENDTTMRRNWMRTSSRNAETDTGLVFVLDSATLRSIASDIRET